MKIIKNFIPLFIFLFSPGCAQNNSSESLSVKDFKERMKNNDTSLVILDVRTTAELTGSLPKIDGAVHIPVQEIVERVEELEKFKSKDIVVVCRTQNRSSRAAEFLSEKGYKARYVNGGMQEFYKN